MCSELSAKCGLGGECEVFLGVTKLQVVFAVDEVECLSESGVELDDVEDVHNVDENGEVCKI